MNKQMARLVDSQGNIKEQREMEPGDIKELNSRLSHKITPWRWEWVEDDPLEGYRGPSAITDEEREANVNEILEFEADNPVEFEPDEITAAIQDPNKGEYRQGEDDGLDSVFIGGK